MIFWRINDKNLQACEECGMELKQDILVVKADALNKQVISPGPPVNSSPGDASLIGDANAACKKKKKK